MPVATFVDLPFEEWDGTNVFVKVLTPFSVSSLGKHTDASDRERQEFFKRQVLRIAEHLQTNTIPVYIRFRGENQSRRMDKGCVGFALASGFFQRPADTAADLIELTIA